MYQILKYYDIFHWYPCLLGIGLVALLATLGHAVVIPILPIYLKQDLGISASLTGIIFGAYAVSETLAKTPIGLVGDRIGRRPVIIGGIFISLLAPCLMILARHPFSLTLIQLMNGLGVAAFWPGLAALTADIVAPENRAQAMTVFNMSYLVALGFGPSLGTFVNHAAGTNLAAFLLAAACLAVATLTGIFSLPRLSTKESGLTSSLRYVSKCEAGTGKVQSDSATGKRNVATGQDVSITRKSFHRSDLKALYSQPVLAAMLLISLLQQFGTGFLAPTFMLYGCEHAGFSQAEMAQVLLAPALTIAVLAIPIGRLADKIGKTRAIRWAFLVAAVTLFLIPAASHPITWQVLVALLGLAYVTGAPAWTAVASMVAPPGLRGAAIAAIGTMQSLGFILGPGVGGLLYDHVSPVAPFLGSSLIIGICFILVSIFTSEKRIAAATSQAALEAVNPAGRSSPRLKN
ncbi:MAG: MFS transporter [Bacillota bacterium]